MKSLNRTLSLVLVLVMVFGLFGVAGAAFTDTATVKYTEAVDVMTGIGAINGYTDGTIKPTATITREEAAKLICYSILGKSVAAKLNVGATGLSDVASDRWSAPFISYLVGKGVISGMGDGTFAPTANVTGYQFAKMMLCAAGYGANGEFKGSGWELAVAVAGNKTKVFSGAAGIDFSKAATREEAMLYAFNGITKVGQVEYNKAFGTYLAKNKGIAATVATGDTIATEVYGTALKKNNASGETSIVDGVECYRWTYNGIAISNYISNIDVLATSKNATAWSDLTNNAKAEYIGYQPDTTVTYYVNGAVESVAATAQAFAATRGVVVTFCDADEDSKYDSVSFTNDTVYTVLADTVAKTTGAVTKVTVSGVTGVSEIASDYVIGYVGLKKDDVVTMHSYVAGGNTYYVINKCNTFTGIMQAYNTYSSSVTVDSKAYKVSALTGTVAPASSLAGKAGTTFYTDACGFVVKAVSANTAVSLANTLLIKATYSENLGEFKAKAVFGDTSSAVITIAKVDSTKMTTATWGASWYVAANIETPTDNPATPYNLHGLEAFTYVKNTDGSYNLTSITDQTKAFAGGVTKATADFATVAAPLFSTLSAGKSGYLATASTLFIYNDVLNDKIATYIGIANAPTVKSAAYATTQVNFLYDSNHYATIVVVNYNGGSNDLDNATVTKDYVFAVSSGNKYYDTVNGDYYMYDAVVNGEIKTITGVNVAATSTKGEMIAGNLYAVSSYDAKHVNERTTTTTGTLLATFTNNSTGNIKRFAINGTTVSYFDAVSVGTLKGSFIATADAKCFFYDSANKTITKLTLAEVVAKTSSTGFTIAGVMASDTDTRIAQFFIIG